MEGQVRKGCCLSGARRFAGEIIFFRFAKFLLAKIFSACQNAGVGYFEGDTDGESAYLWDMEGGWNC